MFVYDNTVLFEFISARFIFMHMRAKNYMGILDLFPSEFSRMRGVCTPVVVPLCPSASNSTIKETGAGTSQDLRGIALT